MPLYLDCFEQCFIGGSSATQADGEPCRRVLFSARRLPTLTPPIHFRAKRFKKVGKELRASEVPKYSRVLQSGRVKSGRPGNKSAFKRQFVAGDRIVRRE